MITMDHTNAMHYKLYRINDSKVGLNGIFHRHIGCIKYVRPRVTIGLPVGAMVGTIQMYM